MTQTSVPLTRRLLLVLGLAAAVPISAGGVAAAQVRRSLEEQMRAALARAEMPVPGTVLELVGFSQDARAGRTKLTAVVRMTWPPGFRQRKFVAEDAVPDLALTALIAEIETNLAAAAG